MGALAAPDFCVRTQRDKQGDHVDQKRVLEFLNSNLGIWLLSSVVLGIVTFSYSQLNSHLSEKEKRAGNITKLQIEILQRTMQFQMYIGPITESKKFNQEIPNKEVQDILWSTLTLPEKSKDTEHPIYAAFQEYKERPMVSLLVELAYLSSTSERTLLEPTVETLGGLTPKSIVSMNTKHIEEALEAMFQTEYWDLFDDEEKF